MKIGNYWCSMWQHYFENIWCKLCEQTGLKEVRDIKCFDFWSKFGEKSWYRQTSWSLYSSLKQPGEIILALECWMLKYLAKVKLVCFTNIVILASLSI